MFSIDLNTLIIIVIIGNVIFIAIAYIQIRKKYSLEFKAFHIGENIETKHKVHLSRETGFLKRANLKEISKTIENNLKIANFIWEKEGRKYCGFHGMVLRYRIKCLITLVEHDTDCLKIKFDFYDRFLSPLMVNFVKKIHERKMIKLYNKLNMGLDDL